MAFLYCYLKKEPFFPLKLLSSFSASEETRINERVAAVKIQSWYRSIKVQVYIRHLHKSAIKIQCVYRGYIGRKDFAKYVLNRAKQLRQSFYNKMATVIQSRWRGYFVRKYKLNFSAWKDYFMTLKARSEVFRENLQEFSRYIALENEWEKQRKYMEEEKLLNRKMHYLISTKVSRGVYNSPKTCLGGKEFLLRNSKPFSKLEREKIQEKKKEMFLRTVTGIPKYVEQVSLENCLLKRPKEKSIWPQGPFRSPGEVRQQRLKKLQTTLRVTTEYKSDEGSKILWRKDNSTLCIVDKKFFTAIKPKYSYVPSLIASTRYGSLNYGTKHFRSYSSEPYLYEKLFQCVVSPIPIFGDIVEDQR
ncbi:spermatogenesis-associated protein 17 isoform X3 [Hydra vulgaris]|uniref:Spermatogenesis-associated protein 17 isoform X3 n=1 Tax=Hydra vulgaris TaxID=6087 RepID=A0ABM4C2N1_HYDVU